MRISHRHKFVFLAMPRTGSTTIRNVLDPYSDVESIHMPDVTRESPFFHHITALELKSIFDERGWDWSSYRHFCMIRNPFDRVVSLYHHHLKMVKRDATTHGALGNAVGRVKKMLKPKTFPAYVMRIDPSDRLPISLRHFVCDGNGEFLVDDILMYERMTEDLPGYLDGLGIPVAPEDIPRLNASAKRSNYREYYDETTRRRVADLYAYEIDRFDYAF